MDQNTRKKQVRDNLALLLALSWYRCSAGEGGRELVLLPYKDRLSLVGRYM